MSQCSGLPHGGAGVSATGANGGECGSASLPLGAGSLKPLAPQKIFDFLHGVFWCTLDWSMDFKLTRVPACKRRRPKGCGDN